MGYPLHTLHAGEKEGLGVTNEIEDSDHWNSFPPHWVEYVKSGTPPGPPARFKFCLGVGFTVQGSGFRFQGSGFRVYGLGLKFRV